MANGDAKTEAVRLDIRQTADMFDEEVELLKMAQLDSLAPIEAWTAIGTNMQLSYATHGAFRYFGKFPPPVATHLIEEYSSQNEWVYDLMSGSGTTGVEALLLNRNCLLNDVNPLSVLLAKVKTTKLEVQSMKKAVDSVVERYRPLSVEEYNFVPVGLRDPDLHTTSEPTVPPCFTNSPHVRTEPRHRPRAAILFRFLSAARGRLPCLPKQGTALQKANAAGIKPTSLRCHRPSLRAPAA